MKQSEIAGRVSAEVSLSKTEAEVAVDAVLETTSDALVRGESVSIAGFGTFSVKHRPTRQGRNPRTGESVEIAASTVPSLKAGKGLCDAVS